jgi:CheY-like chemotaxis protein
MSIQTRPSVVTADSDKCIPLILIAEDDLDDQELIAYAFSQTASAYQLHIVNNGKEAVDYLSGLPDEALPCLLVLDYNMPELNGAEVIKILSANERYKNLPKIVFSTSDSPKYIEHCLSVGADEYMVKPSTIDGIKEAIIKMVSYCS